jgi:hypothetical protein
MKVHSYHIIHMFFISEIDFEMSFLLMFQTNGTRYSILAIVKNVTGPKAEILGQKELV